MSKVVEVSALFKCFLSVLQIEVEQSSYLSQFWTSIYQVRASLSAFANNIIYTVIITVVFSRVNSLLWLRLFKLNITTYYNIGQDIIYNSVLQGQKLSISFLEQRDSSFQHCNVLGFAIPVMPNDRYFSADRKLALPLDIMSFLFQTVDITTSHHVQRDGPRELGQLARILVVHYNQCPSWTDN